MKNYFGIYMKMCFLVNLTRVDNLWIVVSGYKCRQCNNMDWTDLQTRPNKRKSFDGLTVGYTDSSEA